jgi:hypothetical protein
MTTYKGINGFAVQSVGSDPSPLDEGQVWYNNASYAFKLASVTTAGAWASGGALPTAVSNLSSVGTQTAALGFGGYTPSTFVATSTSYNGSSWTGTPSLNTARYTLVEQELKLQHLLGEEMVLLEILKLLQNYGMERVGQVTQQD